MRMACMVLWLAVVSSWGCATAEADFKIRVYGYPNGPVRFEGALAGPYDDLEGLVEEPCERMLEQADATQKARPLGYCVLAFISAEDDEKWFISHIAPIGDSSDGVGRSCLIPVDVVEPGESDMLSIGGAYSGQRGQETWRPTLFLNQRTGETWMRDVMVYFVERPGVCTVYDFSGYSRVVNVWRDGKFVPVGTIYNEQGVIQALRERE